MATAAVQFSTFSEILQANTTIRAGSVLLPSTNTLIGRLVTLKDIAGTIGYQEHYTIPIVVTVTK